MPDRTAGPCFNVPPSPFGPPVTCSLQAGHDGAHQSDGGTTWTPSPGLRAEPTTIADVFANSVLLIHCEAPAPLVANGAPFVGCSLPKDHEGPHVVKIEWSR